MKKFMRIALVFALAGATLVGCTKDYSGDISDLNKKVAEQQSAVTALQNAVSNAQTAADNALANAQNALKEAQAAAKAAADANNDAEVAALTAKVATIEGKIADLEAKVAALDGLEAKVNAIVEQLKADVEADVEAALEEIRAELEEAIAQVEGNFSVEGLNGTGKYASAKWNPGTTKAEKANLEKLAKVFPELAELKKDDVVETFGHIDFIVNPSSVALDDTYKFALIGKDGKDRKVVLGNPAKGFATKAGLNVWNVEVQSPAYNDKGKEYNNGDAEVANLALVVENAAGVYAQTDFVYNVDNSGNGGNFTIVGNNIIFKYDDRKSENSFDAFTTKLAETTAPGTGEKPLFQVAMNAAIYENYFIIEADPADVEKYGIEIEGSKISFTKTPKPTNGAPIEFAITAVSVDGMTDAVNNGLHKATLSLTYVESIAPNADLKTQTVTLGYDKTVAVADAYKVAVKYDFADFEFSAAEKKAVFEALRSAVIKITDSKENTYNFGSIVAFFKNGKPVNVTATSKYTDVDAFGFYVASNTAAPGTYTVEINAGSTFYGKGNLNIQNPEACPVKLIEALCKDGVLQIVGTVSGTGIISYTLEDALVYNNKEAKLVSNSFVDEDQTSSDKDNWVTTGNTFQIPIQGGTWTGENEKQNLLYTPRNLSVKFDWFANATANMNVGTFEFKAQAVSPIYDAEGKAVVISPVAKTTIYVNDKENEPNKFSVNDIVASAKYVAGDNVNKPYNVFETFTVVGAQGATKKHKFVATNYSTITANSQTQATWADNAISSTIALGRLVIANGGEFITISKDNANILRGFGLSDQEILTAREDEAPLYLTENMLSFAYTAGATPDEHGWNAFYNDYGDKLGGTIKSAKAADGTQFTCDFFYIRFHEHFATNATLSALANAEAVVNFYKTKPKSDFTSANWSATVKTKLNTPTEGIEANKVAAYESVKANFDTETDDTYPNTGNSKYWKLTAKRASEIKEVEVGFLDPVNAAKFINKLDSDATDVENQYKKKIIAHGADVNVDPAVVISSNGNEFESGRESVTLKAYLKISDDRGMSMTLPFDVVVKVNSK